MYIIDVCKTLEISAAHDIPNHPGKCKNYHGHNYKIEVWARRKEAASPIDVTTGMVVDFGAMKEIIERVVKDRCDHQYLNHVYPTMITTAENLAVTWLRELNDQRRPSSEWFFTQVRVWETSTCFAQASYEE